jgi:hypothetical protein
MGQRIIDLTKENQILKEENAQLKLDLSTRDSELDELRI